MGDGRLGFPDGAPYDAIHVGAAAPTIPKAVGTQVSTNAIISLLLYSRPLSVLTSLECKNKWSEGKVLPERHHCESMILNVQS